MHDQLCDAPNNRELSRTQSDDLLAFPWMTKPNEHTNNSSQLVDDNRHLANSEEISKYQWWLQKLHREKKDLETANEQLKTELSMVRLYHTA
jgi:hypothetical protein